MTRKKINMKSSERISHSCGWVIWICPNCQQERKTFVNESDMRESKEAKCDCGQRVLIDYIIF